MIWFYTIRTDEPMIKEAANHQALRSVCILLSDALLTEDGIVILAFVESMLVIFRKRKQDDCLSFSVSWSRSLRNHGSQS